MFWGFMEYVWAFREWNSYRVSGGCAVEKIVSVKRELKQIGVRIPWLFNAYMEGLWEVNTIVIIGSIIG